MKFQRRRLFGQKRTDAPILAIEYIGASSMKNRFDDAIGTIEHEGGGD
jgi:hypothetical protein